MGRYQNWIKVLKFDLDVGLEPSGTSFPFKAHHFKTLAYSRNKQPPPSLQPPLAPLSPSLKYHRHALLVGDNEDHRRSYERPMPPFRHPLPPFSSYFLSSFTAALGCCRCFFGHFSLLKLFRRSQSPPLQPFEQPSLQCSDRSSPPLGGISCVR